MAPTGLRGPTDNCRGLRKQYQSFLPQMPGPAMKPEQHHLVQPKEHTTAASLTDEFMVTRAREVLQYSDSTDTIVSKTGIEVWTGRNWRAQEAVNQAESRLQHSSLVGSVEVVRVGLRSIPRACCDKARGKDSCHLVQQKV